MTHYKTALYTLIGLGIALAAFCYCDTVLGANNTAPPSTTQTAASVRWNFRQADIRAVIQTVAALTNKNFVIDPRVQGKITFISNHPMTVKEAYQAFLSMLRVLNFTALPSGQLIKIVPMMDARNMGLPLAKKGDIHGDAMTVKIIALKHVNAAELLPLLQPLVSPYGNIRVYTPSNSLLIADTATNLQHILTMTTQLDQKESAGIKIVTLKHGTADKLVQAIDKLQTDSNRLGLYNNVSVVADDQSNSILVTGNKVKSAAMVALIHELDKREGKNEGQGAQVIALNYLSADKLSGVLNKMLQSSKAGKAAYPIHIQAEPTTNSIIVSGPIDQRQNIEKVIKTLDIRPHQVLVEAIIAEVDASMAGQLGVQWGMTTQLDNGNPDMPELNIPSFKQGVGLIPHGNIQAVINALNKNTSSNVLATPIIAVLNNQKASISDGKSISVTNRTYDSSSNANPLADVTPFVTNQYKDVSLKLDVSPRISPNHYVRLDINQTNDSLADPQDEASVNNTKNPSLNTSKIKTVVMVKSGDILVMGGLIKKDRQGKIESVPILGDIPLLGKLFQYHSHSGEKKDLMVFIRPIILDNRRISRNTTAQRYNRIRDEQLRDDSGIPINKMQNLPLLKKVYGQPKAILPSPYSTR